MRGHLQYILYSVDYVLDFCFVCHLQLRRAMNSYLLILRLPTTVSAASEMNHNPKAVFINPR